MPSRLIPVVAAKTDVGLYRDWNEDSVFASTSPANHSALLIAADGMGGHSSDGNLLGKIASQLVTDKISHELRDLLQQSELTSNQEFSEEYLIERFHTAFQKANTDLNNHPPTYENWGFSTVVTFALVRNNRAIIANNGDCRTYHFRNGKLQLITNNRPLPRGSNISFGPPMGCGHEIRVFRRNQWEEVEPDLEEVRFVQLNIWTQSLQAGDRLLLCSDGLWGTMRDTDIGEHLSHSTTPEDAVVRLIDGANAAGGPDNITVVVCEMVAD